MTSTWSHYNTRETDTHIQKQGEGKARQQQNDTKKVHREKESNIEGGLCGAGAHLGWRPILLHRWRQGAGVAVVGWRLHIVIAEAAEECAEDAPAPLLL